MHPRWRCGLVARLCWPVWENIEQAKGMKTKQANKGGPQRGKRPTKNSCYCTSTKVSTAKNSCYWKSTNVSLASFLFPDVISFLGRVLV